MAASQAEIVSAAMVLAERGLYGFVWLDDDLAAVESYGRLVDFVPLGRPISDSILALLGFEPQMRALRRTSSRSIDIPNVSIGLADGQGPRININVFWDGGRRRYLVLVSRVLGRPDLEIELAKSVRARAIAEAELAEKSEAIARANAELGRANQDLEEFAYIISHDLRAPLRALRYFATDLESALAASNHAASELQIGRIKAQLKRMAAMLSGLLEYSRIGRKHEMIETVDTAELVSDIAASVDRPPGLAIEIEGSWPRLETLAAPLDLVLRNLLDNAIKHHDRPDGGRISLSVREEAEEWVFAVSDDGPGIPASWHKAIFLPFRRMAGDDVPDSAGIGLALVKRTLETMGGRVEVISDPAARRGATFCAHWPKRCAG